MYTDSLKISLDYPEIDEIHVELARLVEELSTAPDSLFSERYAELLQHTENHFQHEEALIEQYGFIHAAEHITEHRQMLNEMRQFGKRPRPMTRAYVRERLAERFALHITRMDSLLVAMLQQN